MKRQLRLAPPKLLFREAARDRLSTCTCDGTVHLATPWKMARPRPSKVLRMEKGHKETTNLTNLGNGCSQQNWQQFDLKHTNKTCSRTNLELNRGKKEDLKNDIKNRRVDHISGTTVVARRTTPVHHIFSVDCNCGTAPRWCRCPAPRTLSDP
jgi:hypothetical protein